MADPTIVLASLDDEKLKQSIANLVAHVKRATHTMLTDTNSTVDAMEKKLKSLGNLKIDSGGSADGGASKRTKSQNAETDAVEKNIAARDKQIKKNQEAAMSFDQIQGALQMAQREVRKWESHKTFSTQDLDKYQASLARVVELNEKLKQAKGSETYTRFDELSKSMAFDAKATIRDLTAVDDRLKQLNKYYKEEEKQSQKATAAIKENTQAKKENASVDQPAKSARDSYIAFMQGYKQQAEQIRRLMEEEQKAMQQRRQGVVDGFTKTIEERKVRVKELSEEVAKLYKERPDDYRDTIKQRTEEMNALKQKIRELTEAQKTLADSPIGASNRYLELEKEYNRIKNIMIDTTNVQRQSTQETEKQAQGAKEYSEQVKRIAAEIRESAQWQKSDKFGFKRGMMNLDGRAYPVTENLDMGLRLEDQIVSILQKANDERQRGVQITQQQAQSSRQVSEEDRKAMEALGWADSQQKKKYMPPMMNVERISEARGALQSITGMQEAWVDSINKTKSSYYQLSDYVKQLKNELIHLPKGVHDEAAKVLIREIQQAEREMQKFQQTMSRPVSLKDALSGSEKTLDDIAYKMQRLRSYKQGIDLTKPNATNEIKQVDEALAKLQKDADKWMSKSQEMIKSNTALGRSWNYMKNRLAFYFTVGASTQFVKNLIEVRSQYEMNERALGILINSAERGTQIFNELSSMALVSPYTLIELSTAAKQLTAYDVAAKDVVDTTRRLADMAAAVGIPIERLTYALGQIKAYGYLNARDARMFSNAGIPLVKQLSDYYTELEGRLVSTADVYDRIKKKAIDYNEVMEVINKMTDKGGKFFDFQAKMAGTLKVQLANLTLAWNNMLNDIGASEQGTISTGIGLLKELFLEWKNISRMITNLAIGFGVVKAAQLVYYGVVMGTNKAIALETVLGNRLSNNLRSLTSSMNAASMSSTALWVGIATFAAAAVVDILRGNEAMKEFNKTLRENAENTYNDLKKFSENYSSLRESLYKTENGKQTPVDINNEEAKKAWEVLREQIELSSHASDEYISKLLSIENVSERLRQGFAMIESIQSVSAAIKELGDSAIKLERDWSAWWNLGLLPDGTIGNLQDTYMWLSKIEEKYGSVENARKVASTSSTDEGHYIELLQEDAKELVENYETELERFREDLQVTKQSIINFIELKGWSGDTSKINEVFKTFTDNLILKNQLDPQQAYTLQLEMEEARSKAAKKALLQRINDEKEAYNISHDEQLRQSINADIARYNNWNETNGRSKVEWERFTKWLKEQHISETTAMFRNMDAEDIKSLNFQKGKHAEWVNRMVTQYAKEHKMSYDEAFNYLKSWVKDANRWSVFIPLIISTEDKKSVYDQLGEYDKAVDKADAQIERLTKRINELNAKKKKSKEETKELADAEKELTRAQKDKADAEAKGGHGKKEKKDEKAANKAAKQAESELAKALKDELSTIDKVRSIYKDLTKEGMSHANAVERATRGWDETVNAINRVLQKNGLQKLDLSKFAGIENPRELVNMLQSQLNILVGRGAKPAEIKELQTKIQTLNVDAEKYDLTKITKGLNNELGKLKDEYELAVAIDADPELGNAFADMMGINVESLPHTVKEYADQYSKYLNKYLKGKDSSLQFTGDELRGLTRDDITAFRKQVDAGSFNQEWFDAIQKAYEDISGKRKKDLEETEKWKNGLIEKYGNLQDKLTKIYKDSVQNQVNAVKSFGTENQKSDIVRLQLRLEATDNPAELTEINTEIAKIVKDVTDKNPIALKLVTASDNQTKSDTSKAYWEDFKNSDMYTMTFEDMANNSSRAIELIIEKLNGLKDKVKEDPASMKALVKSLEDAEKELNARAPFRGVAQSLRDMANASREAESAQKALWRAEVDVEQAQQEYDNAEDGTPEEREAAQQKLAKAIQQRTDAQNNLTKAENKGKKAQENLKSSLQGISNQLGNVQELFGVVSKLFRAGGDDETADAIDAISEGFNTMTTVIMGVVAAMILLEASQPWLLAIAAALSVIVGLVSFLSGNENKKIDAEIKNSELAVKKLELAYIDLQKAVDKAYGTSVIGAKTAAAAAKKLELQELERQLRLEKSRDSKHKDESRIVELQKQIKELRYEIQDTYTEIVNDLMGTDVGSFAENLVSAMVDAFKQGEDAMKVFNDKFDELIDNMIMKSLTSRIVSSYIDKLWEEQEQKIKLRSTKEADELAKAQAEYDKVKNMSEMEWLMYHYGTNKTMSMLARAMEESGLNGEELMEYLKNLYEHRLDAVETMVNNAQKTFDDATSWTNQDTNEVVSGIENIKEGLYDKLYNAISQWYTFGEDSDKNLSALQQGLQSMSEDTANSLEAYMNGVSQQVYYHSTLLEQIRDSVVGLDLDVSLGVQSQMLLQLQNSYQTQQAIQQILEGVLTPSGRAFSVELLS